MVGCASDGMNSCNAIAASADGNSLLWALTAVSDKASNAVICSPCTYLPTSAVQLAAHVPPCHAV